MAKKYIRGAFSLENNVTDLVAFENERETALKAVIAWANDNKVGVNFGTSEDNTYLCEFTVTAQTAQMCKGYVAELKAMLKKIFPKAYIPWQYSGNILS